MLQPFEVQKRLKIIFVDSESGKLSGSHLLVCRYMFDLHNPGLVGFELCSSGKGTAQKNIRIIFKMQC